MSHCEICSYAKEHDTWPSDHPGTHCKDCHRSWTSKAQSHCVICHRHFGSHRAGDAHRVYSKCFDPPDTPQYDSPGGPVWGGGDPQELISRFTEGPSSESSRIT